MVMWVGTMLFGLGMSAIFPTVMNLANQYVSITGRSASLLVVGAAFGEMLLPLCLGYQTTEEYPMAFINIIIAIMLSLCVLSAILFYCGKK